jgi:hypothetical protein
MPEGELEHPNHSGSNPYMADGENKAANGSREGLNGKAKGLKTKEIATFCPVLHGSLPAALAPSTWRKTHRKATFGGLRSLSEELLEGFARIERLGGGGLTLDGRAQQIKVAVVLGVFPGDAGSNRLGAFEPGSSVEKGALLATVQFEATFWTASLQVDSDRQDHRAGGTP